MHSTTPVSYTHLQGFVINSFLDLKEEKKTQIIGITVTLNTIASTKPKNNFFIVFMLSAVSYTHLASSLSSSHAKIIL